MKNYVLTIGNKIIDKGTKKDIKLKGRKMRAEGNLNVFVHDEEFYNKFIKV